VGQFEHGENRYDLIYATFEHQIVTRDADKIIPALKPGGMIVIEGFQEDVSKEVRRPLGYQVNGLLRAFDRLRLSITKTRWDQPTGMTERLRRSCDSSLGSRSVSLGAAFRRDPRRYGLNVRLLSLSAEP
jgi:hypothetical protein